VVDGTNLHPKATDLVSQVAWKSRDLKAHFNLILHCGDCQIQLIISLKTSQKIGPNLNQPMNTNITLSKLGSISAYIYIYIYLFFESQSMTEFLEEWQGALDEAVVARLVIPEALQVTIQSNTPNQTFVKLLDKIFQESTMKQTSNNNFSKSSALFVGNKGKINGDKNKKNHNVSSNITQSTNNNKEFYKDKKAT
jgi:hypothetical protein